MVFLPSTRYSSLSVLTSNSSNLQGEDGRDLAAVGDKTSHQDEPGPHRKHFLLVDGRSMAGVSTVTRAPAAAP